MVVTGASRSMAGDSHQHLDPDTEVEGRVDGTRTRSVSCGEEQASPSPSSPAGVPGAASRRLSLPVALPHLPDSLAAPRPEFRGRVGAQARSWYCACPHRTHVPGGGPPCYLCSVLDVPPKYRRREGQCWHKLKAKLTQFSHTCRSPQQRGALPGRDEAPAAVFTVSEWRPSDTQGTTTSGDVPTSLCAAPEHRLTQERDNPAFDGQEEVESGEGRGDPYSGGTRETPTSDVRNTNDASFVPLPIPLTPLHSSLYGQTSPPPYSLSLVTDVSVPAVFPPRDTQHHHTRNSRCSRRLVCQLIYSLLLATASSTLVVSYEQPILVITSVIVFLTMFVFLPIIALLECLFRCKMEQDFRHYIQNMTSLPSPPPVTPLIH